jgi:hypothetical protein
MAIISEDYCDFETAKLLKEKGFNQNCATYYLDGQVWRHYHGEVIPKGKQIYAAPTQSTAMKWLREVHGLHISLEPCYDYDSMHVIFLAFIQNVADVHEFMDGRKNVASHPNTEKCCELAIKYCLENLI